MKYTNNKDVFLDSIGEEANNETVFLWVALGASI